MEYRKLGRWGVRVSSVGLGSWLTYGGSVESDTATACIHRAYELGVNFFDTADVYAKGRGEEVVGEALKGLRRESYVLATKAFWPMGDGPNDRGLSRKHVVEGLHASLRRLQTDYVDIFQCHRYDVDTPLEETCAAMNDLIRAGKTLYWGTSEWTADQLAHAVSICRANGWAEPVSNQPQYSALWREIEDRVLPTCEDLGLGNVVWSPLAMGILTGKYTSVDDVPDGSRAAGSDARVMRRYFNQDVLDAVAEAGKVADEVGCSVAQLSLVWCLRQRAVSSVIVGASRTQHVDDNVAASGMQVDPAALARFDEILAAVAPA